MKTILVLGAGGFLGSRLAVALAERDGVTVRVGFGSGEHPLPGGPTLKPVATDVSDNRLLESAFEGVDVVVNAIAGDHLVTVNGTQAVLTAADRKGVKRIVQLSSTASYGGATGRVTEATPRVSIPGDDVGEMKAQADDLCLKAIESGQSVIILRIPAVFGAGSVALAGATARRLAAKKWGTLGTFGEGTFNPIDPDDVVSAVLAAIDAPDSVKGAFNIRGPETMTWNTFFKRYNEALGYGELGPMGMEKFGYGYFFGSMLKGVIEKLPIGSDKVDALSPDVPTARELDNFRIEATYAIDKAAAELHWKPSVPFEQSLSKAGAWAKSEGLSKPHAASSKTKTSSVSDEASALGDVKAMAGTAFQTLGAGARAGWGVLSKVVTAARDGVADKIKDAANANADAKAEARKTASNPPSSETRAEKKGKPGGLGIGDRFRDARERRAALREGLDGGESEKLALHQRLFPSHIVFKKMPEGGPDVSLADALDEFRAKRSGIGSVNLEKMTEEERRAYEEKKAMRASLLQKTLPHLIGRRGKKNVSANEAEAAPDKGEPPAPKTGA